ncbi:MAG: HAD-IB family phosphatase [Acidilobaceae archaeon]
MRIRLAVFDVDGVLVDVESSWRAVHEYFGVYEKAREAARLFSESRLPYVKWMELDTRLWVEARGGRLHKSELLEAFSRLRVDPEARPLFDWLRARGVKTALVSGGIDLWVERVAEAVGADYWLANKLSFDKDGYLVPGGVPVVGVWKDEAVRRIASHLGVDLSQVMFVGDSEWDAPAMRIVGYPVGYGPRAREALRGVARYFVDRLSQIRELVEAIERGESPLLE